MLLQSRFGSRRRNTMIRADMEASPPRSGRMLSRSRYQCRKELSDDRLQPPCCAEAAIDGPRQPLSVIVEDARLIRQLGLVQEGQAQLPRCERPRGHSIDEQRGLVLEAQ